MLVSLPPDWKFINSGENGLHFVKLVFTNYKVETHKAVRILDKSVHYYVRGHLTTPSFLAETCRNLQELNDILKNFDACSLCEGCPEKDLNLMQQNSAKSLLRDDHRWRPKTCERLLIPGEKQCRQCVGLMKVLKKPVPKSSKSFKLKKTRVQLKNLRLKHRRALTKIMV